MKRFTTPTHEFTMPIEADEIIRFLLTYKQNGNIVLEKTEEDMSRSGKAWSITLTQQESGKFAAGNATAEVSYLTRSGRRDTSDPLVFYVEDVSNEKVLVWT